MIPRTFTLALARAFVALVITVMPVGAFAADEEPKPDPEKERQQELARLESETRAYPTTRVSRIGDVVQLGVENDNLVLRTTIPPTDALAKVAFDGAKPKGLVTVSAAGAGGAGPYVPEQLNFALHDYSLPDGGMAITQVLASPGNLQIARSAEAGDSMQSVSLIQSGIYLVDSDDKIRLHVQDTDGGARNVNLTLSARNFTELRRKHPKETAAYLEPIFRDLGQSAALFTVDPRAAWQVLADAYEPPADVRDKVQQLVKQLDADDPRQREAASKALDEMGQPAALALMRMPEAEREKLSEEQSSRVDAFLAGYRPIKPEEAESLRKNVEFLVLTLAADDEALRKVALGELKAVAGREIAFDVSADKNARLDAVTKLRDELSPASTQPATQSTSSPTAEQIEVSPKDRFAP